MPRRVWYESKRESKRVFPREAPDLSPKGGWEISRKRGRRDRRTTEKRSAERRQAGEEPLNKLLNSHSAGFYFYLNGVAQIRTVILAHQSFALNLFVLFVNFSVPVELCRRSSVMTSPRPSKHLSTNFLNRKLQRIYMLAWEYLTWFRNLEIKICICIANLLQTFAIWFSSYIYETGQIGK